LASLFLGPQVLSFYHHFLRLKIVRAVFKKTVLITGCSAGGIGDALAQSFHRRGLQVFATARNLSKIEHLKKMGMETLELDVADPISVQNALNQVELLTRSTLDILVDNSGFGKLHASSPRIITRLIRN
jgi:NADP-dependent 3-hydroxy acid dehydrogenase YdfG